MSDDAKDWRWVGEDGAEKVIHEQDLVRDLTSETLPNYTLVWRRGWAEWLPAMQVGELAWALPPGKADTPAKPREKAGAESPPAPPLYRYPVLKRRAVNLKPDAHVSKPVPVPRPPAKAAGPAAAPAHAPRPQAAPAPPNAPLEPSPQHRSSRPPPAPSHRGSRPPPAPSMRAKQPAAPSNAGAKPVAVQPGQATDIEPKTAPLMGPVPDIPKPVIRDAPIPPPSLPRDVPPPPGARRFGVSKAPPPPIFKRPNTLQTPEKKADAPGAVPAPLVPIGAAPPAAAVPEKAASPPRGLDAEHDTIEQAPLPAEGDGDDVEEDIDSLTVSEGGRRDAAKAVETPPMGSEPIYVAPHAPPPASVPPPPSESSPSDALPAFEGDLPKFPAPPPPPADLQKFARVRGERTFSPVQIAGAAAGVIGFVALLIWLFSGSSEPKVEEGVSAATSSAPVSTQPPAKAATPPPATTATAASSGPLSCSVKTPAIKLADHAEPGVLPILTRVPNSQRVAVGFAQSHTDALGITLDPVTLDRDQVFRRKAKSGDIVSVAPLGATGKLHFELTTTKDDVHPAAIIDHHPPFVVGMADGGIARRAITRGTTEVVFPGHEDEITSPRVASVVGVGNLVVFRRGGSSGSVVAGWLTPTGAHLTDLGAIATKKKLVGTPSAAANATGAIIAFAARDSDDKDWQLALATAKNTKNPSEAPLFEAPKGGPGRNLISPVVAGAGNDRFLLQWTEGSSGNRSVRLQVLDNSLQGEGDALNLSPDAVNAGGGAVWLEGYQAISLFFVQHGDDHELWGSALECKR